MRDEGSGGTSSSGAHPFQRNPDQLLTALVVDPDPLIQRAVSSLLLAGGFLSVIAGGSGTEALALLQQSLIGVVVTEVTLPDMAFSRFVTQVGALQPAARVVALTAESDPCLLAESLRSNVVGLLSKYGNPQLLAGRVAATSGGGLILDEITAPQLMSGFRDVDIGFEPVLTAREREVLGLLLTGCTISAAAKRLRLAESTVKSHANKAATRLGMRSSREAAHEAKRRGLLEDETTVDLTADVDGDRSLPAGSALGHEV